MDDALWQSDLSFRGPNFKLLDRITGESISINNIQSFQIGGQVFNVIELSELIKSSSSPAVFADGLGGIKINSIDPTPNVLWDQIAQVLIAEDEIGPTYASRVFSILHTAIYDAFAAYDPIATRVSIDLLGDNFEFAGNGKKENDLEAAMHYAAYEVLLNLFPDNTLLINRVLEDGVGLSVSEFDEQYSIIGRDAAYDILQPRITEMEYLNQISASLYQPQNANSANIKNIEAWTPEGGENPQIILSPEFPLLEPFALPQTLYGDTDFKEFRPQAPEGFFMPAFSDARLDVVKKSIILSNDAQVSGVLYNSGDETSISKSLIGDIINPAFIEQAEVVVHASANLNTEQHVIAEFWEDGLGTAFPPGSMMSFAQFVSERDSNTICL